MDSLEIPAGPVAPALTPRIRSQRPPRIWKFWGTALWGLFIFAAMFVGQIAVVAWFVLQREGPINVAAAVHVVGGGLTISLSVIMGLPAVLAALWIAIRTSRTP
ncbi:MAG TPA: CPBP family intramembrane glutamate endopeptidase, partial [Xanthobacteraceae bacterium]|nr:CPBP family intramembrane glutamate endopeptidase [Xanthobacteraceae bacterium]